MTDLSAAVLLYSAAIIVFYASLNIRPINLETGVRWRPELKIISGFGAAVFAYKSWRIVNRRR
jgi:hypothetical protein